MGGDRPFDEPASVVGRHVAESGIVDVDHDDVTDPNLRQSGTPDQQPVAGGEGRAHAVAGDRDDPQALSQWALPFGGWV